MNRHSSRITPAAPIGAQVAVATPACPTGEAGAPNLPTFDLGAGDYIVTPDDFPDGCFVRTINGLRFGTGENKLGLTVTLALDVPLCGGCDTPLDNGVCADCQLVFVEHLGVGRIAL